MNSDIEYFKARGEKLGKQISEAEDKNRRLSSLRLVFFLVTTVFVILSFVRPEMRIAFIAGAVISFAVFIVLCNKHGKSKALYEHLLLLRGINDRYIARIDGDHSKLRDDVPAVDISGHDYAFDLDVFGDVSLFGLYNISKTYMGKEAFANELLGKNYHSDITARQEACADLIERKEFLQEFEALAIENKMGKSPKVLETFCNSEEKFDPKLKKLYMLLPVLWLVPVILLIIGNRFASAVAIGVALINIVTWILTSGKFVSRFNSASSLKKQVEGYTSLLKRKKKKKASEGLDSLSFVCSLISLRAQPLFALIINALIPFDLYCADKLISWASLHGKEIRRDLEAMSEIEVLMCLSVVGIISRESCFPEVGEGAYFDGKDITHPLLDPSKAVSNSIKLTNGTALITGSNMSGKTTLIRTIGIVCILAYTGAPVPASYVSTGRMRVMSSMRIMDSIEEQMSTFRAELVRIAKIVEAGKEDKPLLFLIDEIFRGTNSADRTEGALKVIENLSKPHIMGLMTTHDYALCDKVTETVKTVVYYHFTEKYNDDGITFDYKLHNGVSHESNAKFLMRLVGIY